MDKKIEKYLPHFMIATSIVNFMTNDLTLGFIFGLIGLTIFIDRFLNDTLKK